MHCTKNLDDGYMGSGTIIKRSINKHGINEHVKTIIEYFSCKEDLISAEKELITQDILFDPLCMNIQPGGGGGFSTAQQIENNRRSQAKLSELRNNSDWLKKNKESRSTSMKTQYQIGTRKPTGWSAQAREKVTTAEVMAKRKNTFKSINHQQGIKNSQYGTKWVVNSENNALKVKGSDVEEFLSRGYILGRVWKAST